MAKKKDKKVELILVSSYTLPESQRTYKKANIVVRGPRFYFRLYHQA